MKTASQEITKQDGLGEVFWGIGRDALPGQHLIYLGIFKPPFILHMRIKFMVRGRHECLNYFYRRIEWQGAR